MTSHVVVAMDLYLASAKDLETMDCFFDLHDVNESPRKTQYPVRDFLVSGHPTQLASQFAFSYKSESQGKNTPWLGVPFIYCNILLAACM